MRIMDKTLFIFSSIPKVKYYGLCFTWVQNSKICQILPEKRNLLRGCLPVKNQWGLRTGDDGVGFRVYSQNTTPRRCSVVPKILSQVVPLSVDLRMFLELPTATNVLFPNPTPINVKVNYFHCLSYFFSNNIHKDQALLAQIKLCYIF